MFGPLGSHRVRASLPLVLGFVLAPSLAASATYHVPGDFSTIGAALAAALSGDTILVSPGIYTENLSLKSGVVLASTDGAEATVIDGGQAGSVMTAHIVNDATVRGFTLTNGESELGGGLYAYRSSFLFEENIVRGNTAIGTSYGGGIYTTLCPTTMLVKENLVVENTASIGGGICCNGTDRTRVTGNTIWNNSAEYASGIISYNGSAILIANNIVAQNNGGKGVYVHSTSTATIVCNDVWANTPVNYHGDDPTGTNGNISLDPLFCAPELDDFRLEAESPCVSGNHPDGDECGWIGWARTSCQPLDIPGACCFEEDECAMWLQNLCEAYGGVFLGQGIICEAESCPPVGSCCSAIGECFVTSLDNCTAVEGTFFVGETCAPSPCDSPIGACCTATGGCMEVDGATCSELGGVFLGEDVPCEFSVCSAAHVATSDLEVEPVRLLSARASGVEIAFRIQLGQSGPLTAILYDASGRQSAELSHSALRAGTHDLSLPIQVASGCYVLSLRVSGGQDVQKVVIVK